MTNCYVVSDGPEAVIIDPAFRSDKLCDYIAEEKLSVNMILMTHGHFDHIMGAPFYAEKYDAKTAIGKGDACMPPDASYNGAQRCGLLRYDPFEADLTLAQGEEIAVGNITLEVIETPGHSPGGISFYTPGHLFCGDTLFEGNVGRADLPGGNFDTLVASIRNKLYVLPDDTKVYCGHGNPTRIGYEKENNYYVRG
jgi:glyoxylase-like metal-dependent hydrolase (beta-lactamase superfamily II)